MMAFHGELATCGSHMAMKHIVYLQFVYCCTVLTPAWGSQTEQFIAPFRLMQRTETEVPPCEIFRICVCKWWSRPLFLFFVVCSCRVSPERNFKTASFKRDLSIPYPSIQAAPQWTEVGALGGVPSFGQFVHGDGLKLYKPICDPDHRFSPCFRLPGFILKYIAILDPHPIHIGFYVFTSVTGLGIAEAPR